jgi:hypothetical protein
MRSLPQCTNPPAEPVDPAVPDLGCLDEQTRQLVLERIVAIAFRGIPADRETGEPAVPPVDPRRAGLGVFRLCGRWFATWHRDPDDPSPHPRELVHIEADPRAPLGLVLHAL